MTADIITIGDEILIGQIIDSNSAWIAQQLEQNGFKIRQITSVSDQKQHIIKILDAASKESDLIIITGGLGPTDDDITKQTLAEYFDTELITNQEILKKLEAFVAAKGLTMNKRNRKQAELPKSCTLLPNDNGTAGGMWFERKSKVFISMPGVPFEMKAMFTNYALPKLTAHFKTPQIIHKTVLTFGIPESNLAGILEDWETNLNEKIKLAYLPSPERLRLRLSMVCDTVEKAEAILTAEIEKLKALIGKAIFGYGDLFLQDVIGDILKANKATLATAESCTGGNISRLITSVPGSSAYFKGAVTAYSNEIKERVLGVKSETLMTHGAVSQETVKEMAQGLLKLFQTDYAIAVSGIAGPGGATKDKPVGTTWIAVADKDKIIAKRYVFGQNRTVNIRRASSKAIDMLRKFILYPEV